MIAWAPALLLAVVMAPSPAHREAVWSASGHRLIARIALQRLTPETRGKVFELLAGESFVDAADWADEVRRRRSATAPLHFVNVPITATRWDAARYCPGDRCVVGAIARYRREMVDARLSSEVRREALKFVIHFIGDVHQPLHVGDKNDRGGNELKLGFMGRESNLHSVWDTGILEAAGMNENHYLKFLQRVMATMDLRRLEGGTVVDWAMESREAAARYAYDVPDDLVLSEEYFDRATAVVDERMIRAGVRLAKLLNDTFGR